MMVRGSGNLPAMLLSGASWAFTHIVYGLLRIRYRGDLRVVAMFAAGIAAVVLLVGWAIG